MSKAIGEIEGNWALLFKCLLAFGPVLLSMIAGSQLWMARTIWIMQERQQFMAEKIQDDMMLAVQIQRDIRDLQLRMYEAEKNRP